MTRSAAPQIDVIVESDHWSPDSETIVRRALAQAAQSVKGDFAGRTLAVLLTDDAAVRRLNATWRGLDKPTNVLSFPAPVNDPSQPLGDIAIAFETAAREAEAEHKSLADHLSHLSVHGFLHLVGYDHDEERQAQEMEALERRILEGLGVPDPYALDESPSEAARV